MRRLLAVGALAAAVVAVPLVGATSAEATSSTAYVSPTGSAGHSDKGCGSAPYSSIQAAVDAVGAGGTVIVCSGTYLQSVVVSTPITLIALKKATIDATGQPPAIPQLPGGSGILVLGTSNVLIKGFTIKNAPFDGVTVAASTKVRVTGNTFTGNGDVGVDLNGSSWSRADHNSAIGNGGGGFLVADDIGPNSHNTVDWNVAGDNPGGCGVIVAGHSTAGVTDNLVAYNTLYDNGTTAAGAGVVIASEVPGETVAYNTVLGNTIWGNGIAGVTIHSHVPGQNLNGNKILDNVIGTNNVTGDDPGIAPPAKDVPDMKTTGILVAASSKLSVLIAGNTIKDNHYGTFIEGFVTATFRANTYKRVPIQVKFN